MLYIAENMKSLRKPVRHRGIMCQNKFNYVIDNR